MANVKARIHLNRQLVAFNIHPKQTKQHSKHQRQPWRSNKNPKTNKKNMLPSYLRVPMSCSASNDPQTPLQNVSIAPEKYLPSQKISHSQYLPTTSSSLERKSSPPKSQEKHSASKKKLSYKISSLRPEGHSLPNQPQKLPSVSLLSHQKQLPP